MTIKILYFLGFLFILLISCHKDDNTLTDGKFTIDSQISVDGKVRTYRVHLPLGYYQSSDTKFPLVIALHGGGGSGIQFEELSGLSEKADESSFVVVYPDGLVNSGILGLRSWNAGKCCGNNAVIGTHDVEFISLLIDKLGDDYHINLKKVYATGHSNGAMLCYRMACELSDKIAAIAANAGTIQTTSPCITSQNIPVIHFHSKLDQNVPYLGGYGTEGISNQYNPSVDSTLGVFSNILNCGISKELVTGSLKYSFYKWRTCEKNYEIHYYLTEDGGHSWPGGNQGSGVDSDLPSTAISNNDLLWDFFQNYQLP